MVAELADRIVVMYRGKIVEQGNTHDLFKNPRHPYVKGLLACRPTLENPYQTLPTVEDFLKAEVTDDGSYILNEHPDSKERLARLTKSVKNETLDKVDQFPILDVTELKVHFYSGGGLLGGSLKTIKAVDGINLRIQRGQTLGLVGESGCGKTTLRTCNPQAAKIKIRFYPL